jgi:uncharacterized protein YjiS (DUF1127 family)
MGDALAEIDNQRGSRSDRGGHALGRLVRRAWAAYWHWQIRRATARLLHSLDDRVLNDLGISRDEIPVYAEGRPPHGSSASPVGRR